MRIVFIVLASIVLAMPVAGKIGVKGSNLDT